MRNFFTKTRLLGFLAILVGVSEMAFFSGAPEIARASSAGPNSPSTGTSVSDGGAPWLNPGNIASSDNAYATSAYSSVNDTDLLQGTGYGFSIPVGATITGITVEIERHYAGNSLSDIFVFLVKGGVIQNGTNRSTGVTWPTSDAYATYGSGSDLWGNTWTVSDINASNFGAVIEAGGASGAGTASVDHIRITVTYTGGASSAVDVQSNIITFD